MKTAGAAALGALLVAAAGCKDQSQAPPAEEGAGEGAASEEESGEELDELAREDDPVPGEPSGDPFADLDEVSRGAAVLWDSGAPEEGAQVVWRAGDETRVALSVEPQAAGGKVTARIMARLERGLAAEVYRCTGLAPEGGSSVRIQIDAEGLPHVLCVNHGAGDEPGSTLGIRLRWDPARRAIVPAGTWKAAGDDVSPDEALRAAAADAGP